MATKSLFESPLAQPAKKFRCSACHDYGIVFLVERALIGITGLMRNSAPCTCRAGDQWQAEYADFQKSQEAVS